MHPPAGSIFTALGQTRRSKSTFCSNRVLSFVLNRICCILFLLSHLSLRFEDSGNFAVISCVGGGLPDQRQGLKTPSIDGSCSTGAPESCKKPVEWRHEG